MINPLRNKKTNFFESGLSSSFPYNVKIIRHMNISKFNKKLLINIGGD